MQNIFILYEYLGPKPKFRYFKMMSSKLHFCLFSESSLLLKGEDVKMSSLKITSKFCLKLQLHLQPPFHKSQILKASEKWLEFYFDPEEVTATAVGLSQSKQSKVSSALFS